jgi:large subunit ribosomal protein L33
MLTARRGCIIVSRYHNRNIHMSQDHLMLLKCGTCKRSNYWTTKNKKQVQRKLEFSKFCKWCKSHQAHKESKKDTKIRK